jgi:hypothetical protein
MRGRNDLLVGYSGIATALLRRCVLDVKSGNGQRADALAFLRSDGCRALMANLVATLAMGDDVERALDVFLERCSRKVTE